MAYFFSTSLCAREGCRLYTESHFRPQKSVGVCRFHSSGRPRPDHLSEFIQEGGGGGGGGGNGM